MNLQQSGGAPDMTALKNRLEQFGIKLKSYNEKLVNKTKDLLKYAEQLAEVIEDPQEKERFERNIVNPLKICCADRLSMMEVGGPGSNVLIRT